jgi:hypothetical protein
MGSKRKTSFRIPTETFNGDCVHVTIMYVVYSITRRSSDWTVLDVWPAQPLLAGSLKMNTALEYSTRVVQEGGRRCKKSTLNDLVHLTPLRIPLMNPPYVKMPCKGEEFWAYLEG